MKNKIKLKSSIPLSTSRVERGIFSEIFSNSLRAAYFLAVSFLLFGLLACSTFSIQEELQAFTPVRQLSGELHWRAPQASPSISSAKIKFSENKRGDLLIQINKNGETATSNSSPDLRLLLRDDNLFADGKMLPRTKKLAPGQVDLQLLGWKALADAFKNSAALAAGKTELHTASYNAVYEISASNSQASRLKSLDLLARDTGEQFTVLFFKH